MRAINLLPADSRSAAADAHARIRRMTRPGPGAIGSAALVLAWVSLAWLHVSLCDSRLRSAEGAVGVLRGQLEEKEAISARSSVGPPTDPLEEATRRVPCEAILALLSQVAPPSVVFHSLSIEYPSTAPVRRGVPAVITVRVEGTADSDMAVVAFTSRLVAAGGFQKLQVNSTAAQQEQAAGAATRFNISTELPCPGVLATGTGGRK